MKVGAPQTGCDVLLTTLTSNLRVYNIDLLYTQIVGMLPGYRSQ